ncbi:hypothetical protein LX15_004995 [Streptoalloteichus tenebrarius]|uniref:Uncharacterized protein n=1 Tax=Streptoalloteichus tenebrarius (strain ATCC 17920 / DSM 40477 / JCM 4838 / CBS 697.72 / NBRC 16177 / NCIMB 11028 / NRRL B-12390 / A12253. 1 / ISP 5477) TaxID=1933 RepID=A0ABT1I0I7_STRSD|nr:hypothetical protein [Streptoalloteichus tenebrarius]MCP2261274.1 hypothetical protein [Streptoalloteichus tenebrarius]
MTPEPTPTPAVLGAAPGAEQRAAIEEALSALGALDALPVAEHVARFDAVHAALTDALSAIDRI